MRTTRAELPTGMKRYEVLIWRTGKSSNTPRTQKVVF